MTDFNKFLKVIERIESEVLSRKNMARLARITERIIYKRTKSGFGVDDEKAKDPKRKKLKPLKPATIKQRQRNGVMGRFGDPRFSNLTDTGQLLDSMVIRAKFGEFQVVIPNSRRRRKIIVDRDGNRRPSKAKKVPTNSEVHDFVAEMRPYFALTGAERKILTRDIKRAVRKIVTQVVGL